MGQIIFFYFNFQLAKKVICNFSVMLNVRKCEGRVKIGMQLEASERFPLVFKVFFSRNRKKIFLEKGVCVNYLHWGIKGVISVVIWLISKMSLSEFFLKSLKPVLWKLCFKYWFKCNSKYLIQNLHLPEIVNCTNFSLPRIKKQFP